MRFGVRMLAGAAAVVVALLAQGAGATVAAPLAVIGYSYATCAPNGPGGVVLAQPDGAGLTTVVKDWNGSLGFGRGNWSFSPDGTRVVFALGHGRNDAEIDVMNVDGSGFRQVVRLAEDVAEPRWSPDGRLIVFEAVFDTWPSQDFDVWVVGVDGTGLRQLTTDGSTPSPGGEGPIGINEDPSWSPDGSRILFVHRDYRDFSEREHLFTMRPDGSRRTQLTTKGSGVEVEPDWSPDGKRIAFVTSDGPGGSNYIATVYADGSHRRQLTHPGADSFGDHQPSWSPDSKRLAFARMYRGPSYCHQVFWINADGSGETVLPGDDSTAPRWQSLPTGRPMNDSFVLPQPLSGSTGSSAGSNLGATKEMGEPHQAGNKGGASVWYRWQSPGTGTVSLDTHGSGFDTLLAVYTGTTVEALTPIAANDNTSGSDLTSAVSFQASAGVVYRIAVDGHRDGSGTVAQGNLTLHWNGPAAQAPANDNLKKAQILTGTSGQVSGWNLGATAEPGEDTSRLDHGGASVWYRWTAPATGNLTLDTQGSGYDTTLWLYTGNAGSPGNLKLRYWADDASFPADLTTRISSLPVDAGTTYTIMIDGYRNPDGITQGNFTLHWTETTP